MSDHGFGEMAFEHGFDNSPTELWRVYSVRHWKDRSVKDSQWFATREAADKHAAWINDGRGEALSITHYGRVSAGGLVL